MCFFPILSFKIFKQPHNPKTPKPQNPGCYFKGWNYLNLILIDLTSLWKIYELYSECLIMIYPSFAFRSTDWSHNIWYLAIFWLIRASLTLAVTFIWWSVFSFLISYAFLLGFLSFLHLLCVLGFWIKLIWFFPSKTLLQ